MYYIEVNNIVVVDFDGSIYRFTSIGEAQEFIKVIRRPNSMYRIVPIHGR